MATKELHSVITIDNEDYNITANKVAKALTVKVGDSETVFDGSEQKSVVINIPTTLPANGGNADTVDNKHASDFILTSQKGTAGGVATLGTDGKVPASQLPSQGSSYTHPDSGVAPGTYQSVTVNAQGHVTSGSILITHGTADPSASTTSQYYFKY